MRDLPELINYAIGIDNGLSGAIAIVPVPVGRRVSVRLTPTKKGRRVIRLLTKDDRKKLAKGKLELPKSSGARDYDLAEMTRILHQLRQRVGPEARIMAVMETPMMRRSGFAKVKADSNNDTLRSMQHGQTSWQVALGLAEVPLIEAAASSWKSDLGLIGKGKAGSLALAVKLFPKAQFASDDAAEAALLAYWLAKHYHPDILRA